MRDKAATGAPYIDHHELALFDQKPGQACGCFIAFGYSQ